ncbi:MAG: AAA family ATPase [Burkholderiales bacterium]|nr:AAA family ATPase [Burkholderiales bacterium]MDR4515887.1 AAA family ATPase [Nitrosomonas sp.]
MSIDHVKTTDTQQPELIQSLLRANVYDHPVKKIRLIETHISWVILTGDYAYKIKKPCNLGFLDFSTLEKRLFYCKEELRLNSRLAAPIYLGIVKITGSPKHPAIQETGDAIEYAIKLIQFPQQAQLDNMLTDGKLENRHIDAFAHLIARFHKNAEIAHPDTCFGNLEHVYQPVERVFSTIRDCPDARQYDRQLSRLKEWSQSFFEISKPLFGQRKCEGYIRECHGDMHLRNLLWLNNQPLAFDCLEFDPDLRWIDTLSEVAFLIMDLQNRRQPKLAQRFLNSYLELCGDYSGLGIFRFYLVYRALVRAMVDIIRAGQPGVSVAEKQEAVTEFYTYIKLALFYIHSKKPVLIITHGLSGSGKSTLSLPLLEQIGAIRIRSDVERKRMFGLFDGLNSTADTQRNVDGGGVSQEIYSVEANIKTYKKLKALADAVLDSGFPVIVDAAFLKYEERHAFLKLARDRQTPFIILKYTASANTLRQRISARKCDVSDADIAVLEHQLATFEPLRCDELPYQITIDTEKESNIEKLILDIKEKSR